jgi:dTDP-4-amino-4,6-dideoxygalactose transaminase
VDVGSSFLPSDIISAFLYAQLEELDQIQKRRIEIWNLYYKELSECCKANGIRLPMVPEYATNNAHMFYLVFDSSNLRSKVIEKLKEVGILSVFHYLSLHKSPFYIEKHDGRTLINSDRYTENLLRLPLYVDLQDQEVLQITHTVREILNG